VAGVLKHTLFVSNDNDFLAKITDTGHPKGIANPNQFFVLSVDAGVLPGLDPQSVARTDDDADDDDDGVDSDN